MDKYPKSEVEYSHGLCTFRSYSEGVKYMSQVHISTARASRGAVHRSTARVIRLALLELAVTQHHTIRHICQFRNSHLVIGGVEKISDLVMEVWNT